MKTRLVVVLSLIMLAVFGMGNLSFGQNEVTESWTVSYYGTIKMMQLVPGSRYVTWENFGVPITDSGQGLFHGATLRLLGTSVYGKESWTGEFYGTYTLKDGEKVFASGKMSGKVATPPVPYEGTLKLLGGTGKYSGIQGSGEYVSYPIRPPADGALHSYSKTKMTYKLP